MLSIIENNGKLNIYQYGHSVRALLGYCKIKSGQVFYVAAPGSEVSLEKLCEILEFVKQEKGL